MNVKRTCCVCKQKQDKKDLYRIVKNGDTLNLDNEKKLSGKATYVCKNGECLNRLIKLKSLSKAFRTNINISEYEKIIKEIDASRNN